MCDWVSIGLLATGAALSTAGGIGQANAARDAASAIRTQNFETLKAQDEGFNTRIGAQNRQTQEQLGASNQTLADRNAAFTTMRQGQTGAMDLRKQIVEQENQRAQELRATGDQAANTLLDQTTAQRMADMETQRAQAQNLLLDQNQPSGGPDATNPNATSPDANTAKAIARRTAEAATSIRDYGAKVAKVGGYGQPMFGVGQAITANQQGIMPAQEADKLLRAGAGVRILPSDIAYRSAGAEGGALDTMAQQRGEAEQGIASTRASNAITGANLTQTNLTTEAANKSRAAQAAAAFKQQQWGMLGSLGQLVSLAGGAYGMFADAPTQAAAMAKKGIAMPGSFSYAGL